MVFFFLVVASTALPTENHEEIAAVMTDVILERLLFHDMCMDDPSHASANKQASVCVQL